MRTLLTWFPFGLWIGAGNGTDPGQVNGPRKFPPLVPRDREPLMLPSTNPMNKLTRLIVWFGRCGLVLIAIALLLVLLAGGSITFGR